MIAGTIDEPPRWVSEVGLEWMVKLATGPCRRFWRRYLIGIPRFAWLTLLEKSTAAMVQGGRFDSEAHFLAC